MQRGIMISLEGIDGAGKTTQRDVVEEYLQSKGIKYIVTREPGGTYIAEKIRELLLSKHDEPMDIVAETMLFYAARKQHIEAVIEPHLAKGYVVLCDRFADSTFAYQRAKGIRSHQIADIEKVSIGFFKPDYTFYFDIDIDTSMQRAAARGKLDRMEEEFYKNAVATIEGYKMRIVQDPARFLVIDGRPHPTEVAAVVRATLDKIIVG
jgi:dTMP kinase